MLLVVAVLLVLLEILHGTWAWVAIGATGTIEICQTLFWLWLSQRRAAQVGAETMLGSVGEVTEECRPHGLVRVHGELWRARCGTGAERGARVRVVGRDGLTLEVEREPL